MMANWETPKTNYDPATVVGPGDLNRIEGNIEHLKELVDPNIKYVIPSDNVLLSATAERSQRGTGWETVKRFRVKNEGVYRITYEMRTDSSWGSVGVRIEVDSGAEPEGAMSLYTSYRPGSVEIYARIGTIITVQLRGGAYDAGGGITHLSTGYIRNVRVRGTITTRAYAPGNAVLQN